MQAEIGAFTIFSSELQPRVVQAMTVTLLLTLEADFRIIAL